ncbi:Mss4-like protein [Cercophora newfieldiana]|uniref:Mss4-like protein n=1 Tax=Cercophora newfieldiana TaxID=92897 RepID=A0AA39XTS7_9PEZI|nr:Mss4-like protein [Cercophora newfieldiana]
MAASTADKSKPYIPHAGLARDGWSKDGKATATCYCGAVQLVFSLDGVTNTFVCNCVDCRKITASMFASNFAVKDTHFEHARGKDVLKTFSQSETIASGKAMTNYFCGNCGSLMYRVPERLPGVSILRLGTVDDFSLHETRLKPRQEHWTKDRVCWFTGVQGVAESFEGQGGRST